MYSPSLEVFQKVYHWFYNKVINIYDGNKYPQLPVMDKMNNNISFVASLKQISILEQLSVTQKVVKSTVAAVILKYITLLDNCIKNIIF